MWTVYTGVASYEKVQQYAKIRIGGRDMEMIKRDIYLNRLIERRENGLIKVVTGIRRCGKSYLLFKLYYQYLLASGIDASRIIRIPLDDEEYEELRESKRLSAYIKERLTDDDMWYIFLDEVQLCSGFEAVLNGLNRSKQNQPPLPVFRRTLHFFAAPGKILL